MANSGIRRAFWLLTNANHGEHENSEGWLPPSAPLASAVAAGAARGLADAPIAGPVGETPAASRSARSSVWPRPERVFRSGRGSVPETLLGSTPYALNWSFAEQMITNRDPEENQ